MKALSIGLTLHPVSGRNHMVFSGTIRPLLEILPLTPGVVLTYYCEQSSWLAVYAGLVGLLMTVKTMGLFAGWTKPILQGAALLPL